MANRKDSPYEIRYVYSPRSKPIVDSVWGTKAACLKELNRLDKIPGTFYGFNFKTNKVFYSDKFTRKYGESDLQNIPAKPNPAPAKKRIKRVGLDDSKYINRPSQISRKTPTKRLVERRAENLNNLGSGYFLNPSGKFHNQPQYVLFDANTHGQNPNDIFAVLWANDVTLAEAKQLAEKIANRHNVQVAIEKR